MSRIIVSPSVLRRDGPFERSQRGGKDALARSRELAAVG
jgi:hypothetical protein